MRILLLIAGFCFTGLAFVGIVLPILVIPNLIYGNADDNLETAAALKRKQFAFDKAQNHWLARS
ncbi:MAG TPA: hypothetical protein ENN84_09275 [Candidatus Marinimicrobia bacterium]|nr:hypothetical protein [Candidatus Neomarinimicrobiota bacterium]